MNIDRVVMGLGKGTVLYGNRALAAAHMNTVRKRGHMVLRIRVEVHPGKGHIPAHLGQPTKAVQVIHRHLCHGKVAALGEKGACRLYVDATNITDTRYCDIGGIRLPGVWCTGGVVLTIGAPVRRVRCSPKNGWSTSRNTVSPW